MITVNLPLKKRREDLLYTKRQELLVALSGVILTRNSELYPIIQFFLFIIPHLLLVTIWNSGL